jgi:hypothetical protein
MSNVVIYLNGNGNKADGKDISWMQTYFFKMKALVTPISYLAIIIKPLLFQASVDWLVKLVLKLLNVHHPRKIVMSNIHPSSIVFVHFIFESRQDLNKRPS